MIYVQARPGAPLYLQKHQNQLHCRQDGSKKQNSKGNKREFTVKNTNTVFGAAFAKAFGDGSVPVESTVNASVAENTSGGLIQITFTISNLRTIFNFNKIIVQKSHPAILISVPYSKCREVSIRR